ncbi:YbaY family lipoprotein [Candidatus Oscillochloris fontis]|uniref:YbaY family lipoprotein n=1 Tax=Candidatus Oscillochloris fontis TaxID=2496868 RepID=UPI00137593BA|nr:YbaY family lipoprotein [Candidatus Oscillochloris fontis]
MFLILVACALLLSSAPNPVAAQSTTTLNGVIYLSGAESLPSSAIVTIQLADVTITNEPPVVITERIFSTSGAQSPFSFSLPYDPAQINGGRRYILQGNIRLAGQVIYRTSVAYPVLTFSNPTSNLQMTMYKLNVANVPQASAGTLPLLIALGLFGLGVGVGVVRRRLM